MDTIIAKYTDGSTINSKTFVVPAVFGIDEPDDYEFWPGKQFTTASGGIREFILAFRRCPTIDFGIIQDHDEQVFIEAFLQNTSRSITYNGEEVFLLSGKPDGFVNEWIENIRVLKHYQMRFKEQTLHTVWTSSTPIADNMIGYIISDVEVDNDETNPELFTTGVGKLATDDGSIAIPSISLLTYNVKAVVVHRQEALVIKTDKEYQNGGNISFHLGYALAGNPMADGKYRVDIALLLQTR